MIGHPRATLQSVSTVSRRLRSSPGLGGGVCRRCLHLQGGGVEDLLKKSGLEVSTSSPTAESGTTIRISASRQLNRPVICIGDNAPVPLDIAANHVQLDSKAKSGVMYAADELWSTWKRNDLLRLVAKVDSKGQLLPATASANSDDFALFRQPHLQQIGNTSDKHPLEKQAEKGGLFYHKVRKGGNIATYGYGAGVAMSTMDALAAVGGEPANFLDGGGGATEANVVAALGVVTSDKDADVVFINSFGGITKMGVVDFLRDMKSKGQEHKPFVLRLRGTGEESAKQILEEANLPGVQYIPDLRDAAAEAVRIANKARPAAAAVSAGQPVATLAPVVFSKEGQYEKTVDHLLVEKDAPVLIMGTGKASAFHNGVAQKYGTNIVGACAPGKGGSEFLSKPVFGSLSEAMALKPRVVSVFVPPKAAADAIIECVEAEVPLVVAYAEGVPTHDQLRIQAAIRSQSKSRLVGPNCPGLILPLSRVKLGIQPLSVHSPGIVGLASRSGTISYELASQTTALGLGQSVVFGLGGDPFPGTRTWEALSVMLNDPKTKVVCLIGEVGGQMEEEVAQVYKDYLANLAPEQSPKPVVGFIAGQRTERGKIYGHAGAVWYDDVESAASKKKCWDEAGIVMAETLGDVGELVRQQAQKIGAI